MHFQSGICSFQFYGIFLFILSFTLPITLSCYKNKIFNFCFLFLIVLLFKTLDSLDCCSNFVTFSLLLKLFFELRSGKFLQPLTFCICYKFLLLLPWHLISHNCFLIFKIVFCSLMGTISFFFFLCIL